MRRRNGSTLLYVLLTFLFILVGCDLYLLEPTSYTLTIQVEGQGTIEPVVGEHIYEEGTIVYLKATPLEGWSFKEWVGEVQERERASTTVVMNKKKTVKAVFVEEDIVTLTIEQEGRGTLIPSIGHHLFHEGQIIDIEAIADNGWIFDHWIGDVAHMKEAKTTVTMDEDKAITAVFIIADDHEVVFHDANLELAVLEALHRGEGPLYVSDVIGIEVLDAKGRGIVSLGGIENLRYLERLELGYDRHDSEKQEDWTYNYIESITPLFHLTELKYLYIENNQIMDLAPLESLRQLKWLVFSHNQVSDLRPLENLTKLEWLTLFHNQVTTIEPLRKLENLEWLVISSNQITDLHPLENLTNLEVLWIQNNQISNLSPLKNLTKMKWIICQNNQISDLSPLENLTHLSSLWLDNNQITDLHPLKGLTHLIQLPFDDNQVEDLSPLEDLIHLNWVRFKHNQVSDISPLVNNTGFGLSDSIDMRKNFLDLTPGSQNMIDIETLLQREVDVMYDPQQDQTDEISSMDKQQWKEDHYKEKMIEYLNREIVS